jgi:hypothetical protein
VNHGIVRVCWRTGRVHHAKQHLTTTALDRLKHARRSALRRRKSFTTTQEAEQVPEEPHPTRLAVIRINEEHSEASWTDRNRP